MTEFLRPSLTLVTDRNLYRPEAGGAADPLSLVEAAIAGGVDIVQLRSRTSGQDALGFYAVAMRLREMTADRALFVMTGDLDLAEKCHADGILLPESTYKHSDARNYLRGSVRLVGQFVDAVNAASRAERGGADYVQVGPVFGSDDVHGSDGLALLRKIKDAIHVPVIAFGGIRTIEHVEACVAVGADGIAVSDGISHAPDPQTAAKELRSALDASWAARDH